MNMLRSHLFFHFTWLHAPFTALLYVSVKMQVCSLFVCANAKCQLAFVITVFVVRSQQSVRHFSFDVVVVI